MIDTTYIRLERAAEMLGTDPDTLLIAAIEKRIQLFGLLGQYMSAELWVEERDQDQKILSVHPQEVRSTWFTFVPLFSVTIANLMLGQDVYQKRLTPYDNSGEYLMLTGDEALPVSRDHVFAKRDDIQAIQKQGVTPSVNLVEPEITLPPNKSAEARKENTLLRLFAAALDQLGVDPNERGVAKKISEWTEHLGNSVTEDTVKKYLHRISADAQS